MATLILKPEEVSLSGNIKDIVLLSLQPVVASLKHNNSYVFKNEVYTPNSDGKIIFPVGNAIKELIQYPIPGSANILTVSPDTFIFSYDGTEISFKAIKGGVDSDIINSEIFLTGNFLTWQPQTVHTTYYQPQWLRYYSRYNSWLRIKAYFANNITDETNAYALPEGLSTINLNYGMVAGLFNGRQPQYYDVWIVDNSGKRLSYVQRYLFRHQDPDEDIFVFENSLGGFDSIRFIGSKSESHEMESFSYMQDDSDIEHYTDFRKIYTKNTGHLTDDRTRLWALEFFKSTNRYYVDNGALRRIIVSKPKLDSDLHTINNYEFKYSLSSRSNYLNLPRAETLPEVIEIEENGELFFLAPRLNEFQSASLEEELLFLTQGLFDKTWKYISLEELISKIEFDVIDKVGSGGSGEGNIFGFIPGEGISFSVADDKIKISHGKTTYIAAPYIDKFGHVVEDLDFRYHPLGGAADRDFIMRDGVVYGSLSSELFISGFPAGRGWAITSRERLNAAGIKEQLHSLEIDEITVRRQFRVYEMIRSQLLGENGTRLTTDMMKVVSIDAENNIIYLDTEGGILYNPFRTDDVIRVQVFGGADDITIKEYEFVVDAVGVGTEEGEARVDWIRYRNFVGNTSDVAARDTLVRIDNLTNLDRKGVIKTTSVEPHGPYQDVVYGMATDPSNAVRLRQGRLSGIVTPEWGRLQGYGLYSDNVYLKGRFALTTGEDVLTKFNIIEGNFTSEMQSLREEVSAKDNLLQNGTWGNTSTLWRLTNDISLFTGDNRFVYLNDGFYADQRRVTSIKWDEKRYAMSFKNGRAVQLNADIKDKPDAEGLFYASLRIKCIEGGVLRYGIEGSEFFKQETLTPTDGYIPFEFSANWNGTGNFVVEFTGQAFIHSAALTRDPFGDLRTEFTTKIEQTQYEIALLAQEVRGDIETLNSRISVTSQGISAVSSRVSSIERASSGWITTADATNIFAKKNDIISYINVSPGDITISSDKININGIVTKLVADDVFVKKNLLAENIAAINITTNKLKVTSGATIGGFIVDGQDLKCAGGYISGFAWKWQEVSSDTLLYESYNFINCINDQQITLTLSFNSMGKPIYIRRSGAGHVVIKPSGIGVSLVKNSNLESQIIMSDRGGLALLHCSRNLITGISTWYFNFIGT